MLVGKLHAKSVPSSDIPEMSYPSEIPETLMQFYS